MENYFAIQFFAIIDLITYLRVYIIKNIHSNGIPECVKNNHNGRCIFKETYVNGLFLFLMNDENKNIKNQYNKDILNDIIYYIVVHTTQLFYGNLFSTRLIPSFFTVTIPKY